MKDIKSIAYPSRRQTSKGAKCNDCIEVGCKPDSELKDVDETQARLKDPATSKFLYLIQLLFSFLGILGKAKPLHGAHSSHPNA